MPARGAGKNRAQEVFCDPEATETVQWLDRIGTARLLCESYCFLINMLRNEYMRFCFALGLAACGLAAPAALSALPPWISLEERTRNSDLVLVGEVQQAGAENFTNHARRGEIRIRRLKTLKGRLEREFLNVSFLMAEGMSEGKIGDVPERGTYLVFLKRQQVRDAAGHTGTALVLYRPHLFAFAEYSAENEAKVKAAAAGN